MKYTKNKEQMRKLWLEKNDRLMLRELIRKTEEQQFVEDAYSAKHVEDATDDDIMTDAEQGFMVGYTA